MSTVELAVQTRETFGKAVRRLRTHGFVPAELYGHGVPNRHLSVELDAFLKAFRVAGENTVIALTFGGDKVPVIIHDVQRDFLSGEVSHVDFYAVRADEKITAKIPIEFVGEAPAVKEYGASVNKSLHEIEVEALPADLPHHFTVNLGVLKEVNASVYVKDVAVTHGVEVLVDPETVIATAVPAVEEKVEEKPIDVSEVKVESEEKKAQRAEGEGKEKAQA